MVVAAISIARQDELHFICPAVMNYAPYASLAAPLEGALSGAGRVIGVAEVGAGP